MKCPAQNFLLLLAALCCAALCGCAPVAQGHSDEEKEPHFITGKSRVRAMDYQGAIESFEKALEENPRSASAHFELGWLLADKTDDLAGAIYHYERYLKLRPEAENADIIRQHILRFKQELAKAVLPMPNTPGLQREFEQLAEDNRRLRDEVEKWRAYYAGHGGAPTNPPAGNSTTTATRPSGGAAQGAQTSTTQTQRGTPTATGTATAARTYTVKAGDTPAAIARKYNLKLDALMAANPGLDPRKMKVGQTMNLPAQ